MGRCGAVKKTISLESHPPSHSPKHWDKYRGGDSVIDIFEVLEELGYIETEYRNCKEALLLKEDSLHLHADWDALKKEKSITNQRQREAYIRECTQELRNHVTQLQLQRDSLKRTYTALLWMNKPYTYDVAVQG